MLGDLAMTCGHLLTYVSVQSLRMDLHTIVTLQSVSNHTWRISLFWILDNGSWRMTNVLAQLPIAMKPFFVPELLLRRNEAEMVDCVFGYDYLSTRDKMSERSFIWSSVAWASASTCRRKWCLSFSSNVSQAVKPSRGIPSVTSVSVRGLLSSLIITARGHVLWQRI